MKRPTIYLPNIREVQIRRHEDMKKLFYFLNPEVLKSRQIGHNAKV